jgi:hypothetical protein
VDSEADLRGPSVGAFQDRLKLEVALKIQVMGGQMVQLMLAPVEHSLPHLC